MHGKDRHEEREWYVMNRPQKPLFTPLKEWKKVEGKNFLLT
jgi:hypothetical protein